ncbi:hypothetical protein OS493_012516 [Desmophyllum pertusum]|uniref:AMP-dependent synthetase/ligase domain-containing protein n=1 Tax=Desmophyllum pertusum TaxID=174260 RepID=A0A9X0CY22_9CNID|nr:hypothetical protein OS493_012516 [Desmophyllum pertusum]
MNMAMISQRLMVSQRNLTPTVSSNTSIKKLASALTKRGFKKGDVFALYLPNVPEYPILFFGVIALGGVVTTLNPTFMEKEIGYQLKDSGAKYIITVPAIADKARHAAAEAGIKEVFCNR